MSDNLDQHISNSDLTLTEICKRYLITIAKWANFLSIIGFIGLGLMTIAGIALSVTMGSIRPEFAFLGLVYIAVAVLYLFPTLYLLRFSKKMKWAIETISQDSVEEAFENLKSFFKFIGIFTIIIISLYILLFIIGVGIGGMMR